MFGGFSRLVMDYYDIYYDILWLMTICDTILSAGQAQREPCPVLDTKLSSDLAVFKEVLGWGCPKILEPTMEPSHFIHFIHHFSIFIIIFNKATMKWGIHHFETSQLNTKSHHGILDPTQPCRRFCQQASSFRSMFGLVRFCAPFEFLLATLS